MRARDLERNHLGAPPNALCASPFPTSVVNTDACKRVPFETEEGATSARCLVRWASLWSFRSQMALICPSERRGLDLGGRACSI
jgi:hypothetical protein